MNTYEKLLAEIERSGAEVVEEDLGTAKSCGKCIGKIILLNKNMSLRHKRCILAEEAGHYHKTVGDITDQTKIENRKQELIARRWGYEKLAGIMKMIDAFENGAHSIYEIAECLDITEDFLKEAISYYKSKYGLCYEIDNYLVYFEPYFGVMKMF